MSRYQADVAAEAAGQTYGHALWYAFGVLDAAPEGKYGALDRVDDPSRFAAEQRQSRFDYEMGKLSFRPAMDDAWKAYVERRNAEEHRKVQEEVRDLILESGIRHIRGE